MSEYTKDDLATFDADAATDATLKTLPKARLDAMRASIAATSDGEHIRVAPDPVRGGVAVFVTSKSARLVKAEALALGKPVPSWAEAKEVDDAKALTDALAAEERR